MVKLEDGSLVPAADLINGSGEDPEGQKLKFKLVKDATMPAYEAVQPMDDGSGRVRHYRFGFDDTNVTVHMSIVDERAQREKAVADTAALAATEAAKAVAAEKQKAKNESSPPKQQQLGARVGYSQSSQSRK